MAALAKSGLGYDLKASWRRRTAAASCRGLVDNVISTQSAWLCYGAISSLKRCDSALAILACEWLLNCTGHEGNVRKTVPRWVDASGQRWTVGAVMPATFYTVASLRLFGRVLFAPNDSDNAWNIGLHQAPEASCCFCVNSGRNRITRTSRRYTPGSNIYRVLLCRSGLRKLYSVDVNTRSCDILLNTKLITGPI